MNNTKSIENILKRATKEILLNGDIELDIIDKGHQDVVTQKDLMIENFIIKELKKLYPKDSFIAEEEHQGSLTDNRTWILDPIDGTLNFSRNHPLYGIQVALYEKKEAILSVIYLPATDEMYTAIKGHGAYLNGTHISQPEDLSLEKAIVSLGDFSKSNPSSRPFQIKIMEGIMDKAMKLRIQGASSVDFAYACSGKTNCHILFTKRIWELASGILLAEESGMTVNKFKNPAFEGHGFLIASNDALANSIIEIINNL